MKMKEKLGKLKRKIPVIYLALKKKQTPWYAKVLAGLTIAYALSPIDLIPDFIPVLGYLDDVILLPLLLALTVKAIPAKVFEECETEAQLHQNDKRPK